MSLPRKLCGRLVGSALAVAVLCGLELPAQATVVERIVAVVGDRPILLSDLRERARVALLQIYANTPDGATRSAHVSQVLKEVLEVMIDEELQKREAIRANLVVSSEEVDRALDLVAKQNNITRDELIAEAMRTGLTEKEYREQLRLQLMQQKLMSLRLQGRIRVTEEDARNAYRTLVMRERRELPFRVAWIVLRTFAGSDDVARQKRALADRLVAEARSGADFSGLARRFSEDAETKAAGGLLPQMRPRDLPAELSRVASALEVGEVSGAVRVGDDLFVMKMIEREPSKLPAYDEARSRLLHGVESEKAMRAHRQWLQSLRRRTHIEVRL